MRDKNSRHEQYESINSCLEKDIHFEWSDIAAMTIAALQILLPITLFVGTSVAAFMLFFTLIMN